MYRFLFPSPYTATTLKTIPLAPQPNLDWLYSLYSYHSTMGRKLLYDFKRRKDLVRDYNLAIELADSLKEILSEKQQYGYFLHPIIITVPLSKMSRKERGFHQVKILARYCANIIDAMYIHKAVNTTRAVQKQALLSKKERYKNVYKAFEIKQKYIEHIAYKDVLILDDIITSGATMEEIRRVLKSAGAREIIGVSIAH
tara:strand:- start:3459 stop:4055 length:597 start_codon:yes stop_codon:yes gene_type:complete